ncbi:MAG: phosphopantothenoylcysteine decarboxylase [Ferruginibacter sp.]
MLTKMNVSFNSFLFTTPPKNQKSIDTAGPTMKAIVPVRYINNHSSGKMVMTMPGNF